MNSYLNATCPLTKVFQSKTALAQVLGLDFHSKNYFDCRNNHNIETDTSYYASAF